MECRKRCRAVAIARVGTGADRRAPLADLAAHDDPRAAYAAERRPATADIVRTSLTTTQFGTMVVLRARKSLDQVGIATMVGIDRSTTALVVSKLEEAGYIERRDDRADKRRKIITLSKAGHAMLDRVAEPAQRARERALHAFSTKDAAKFLALLERFVDVFNEQTRAPIRTETGKKRG